MIANGPTPTIDQVVLADPVHGGGGGDGQGGGGGCGGGPDWHCCGGWDGTRGWGNF